MTTPSTPSVHAIHTRVPWVQSQHRKGGGAAGDGLSGWVWLLQKLCRCLPKLVNLVCKALKQENTRHSHKSTNNNAKQVLVYKAGTYSEGCGAKHTSNTTTVDHIQLQMFSSTLYISWDSSGRAVNHCHPDYFKNYSSSWVSHHHSASMDCYQRM